MTDEQRVARLVLIIFGSVVIVMLVGYFLFSAVGGGLGGGGASADLNGEYMFMIDLEEDRGTLPEEEIFVFVDLMQTEDGYLTGQGYAGYGSNEFEVKVTEGQVSEDGRLYLELYGYDNDDIFKFQLYDDEGAGIEGTAEGYTYFEDSEESAARADAVSFVGDAE